MPASGPTKTAGPTPWPFLIKMDAVAENEMASTIKSPAKFAIAREANAGEIEGMMVRSKNGAPVEDRDGDLEQAVALLKTGLDPTEIWLFGSRARGDARADSDYDLLVVMPRPLSPIEAWRPLCGRGLNVDVIPCQEKVFAESSYGVCAATKRDGIRLYRRGHE